MPGETWTRTPEEWQNLMISLLTIRHGDGNLVTVPDTVQGDFGLECFTRDGRAYQCYAAKEPLNTRELTQKQKAKVTKDVAKLAKYKDQLAELLGPTILDRWILVVPRWEDKSLISHAQTKLDELHTKGLSFISTTIVPAICTGADFVIERGQLHQSGVGSLRVDSDLVNKRQVDDWVSSNDELVHGLDRKSLAIRNNDQNSARKLRNEMVRHYLDGQNALDKLREDYPDLFEAVNKIKKDQEHFLVSESLITTSLPPGHLQQTREALATELGASLSGLSSFTVQQFVFEAVADWLIRCPLDFP